MSTEAPLPASDWTIGFRVFLFSESTTEGPSLERASGLRIAFRVAIQCEFRIGQQSEDYCVLVGVPAALFTFQNSLAGANIGRHGIGFNEGSTSHPARCLRRVCSRFKSSKTRGRRLTI